MLTVENALETLETAQLLCAEAMKAVVLEFIMMHFKEVMEREELQSLPVCLLVELLRWKAAIDPS